MNKVSDRAYQAHINTIRQMRLAHGDEFTKELIEKVARDFHKPYAEVAKLVYQGSR